MASAIAHPFIALALTPWFRRSGITPRIGCLGALCTIFPDVDVVGFHLGIPYDSLLGHRGMTHSVAFAAALAAVLTLGLRRVTPGVPVGPVFLFLALCGLSHGLLDALTDGGLGVAFFSPFSNARYFFPWHPISVSPLSITRFLSGRAGPVLWSELLWVILPCIAIFLLGLRSRVSR